MADKYTIERDTLIAIANAIRSKTGSTATMTPEEMVTAIESISGDSSITEVEYIRSNGTQYIDTGVIPTNKTAIEIDFVCGSAAGNQALFGSGQHFCCSLSSTGGGILWNYPKNSIESNVTADANGRTFAAFTTTRNVLKLDKGVIYRDGVECYTFPQSTFTGTYNIGLFCQIRASVIDYKGSICMYGCKIWEDGVLIREFVPAVKNSVAGLYDRVDGAFYTSISGTAFLTI